MDGKEIFIAIGEVLLAAYGSLVRWLNTRDKRRQTAFVLLGDMSAAVLSGIIVYLFFYRYLKCDVFLCLCIAPVLGLLGYEGVKKIEPFIFKRAGIDGDAEMRDGDGGYGK